MLNNPRCNMEILSIHKTSNPELKRRFTLAPYSRKNWKEMKRQINTFFTDIETDFRLLHKPHSLTFKEIN